ncbi:alpha/beta hydrolase [Ramlibacter sp. G-1-2-2]|uniref:Alpha/beta hydrolase n=1 Tax=Ramlibacter agri TaxID=2728837 RepID=A0A848HAG9_9BURK|nr:alpha/beta hydrolase [Ramlibacter agri]NML47474.1 alpha/beta hydrolase [Ramlibacter agri]
MSGVRETAREEGGLVALDTTPGAYMESQSGLQRGRPRIYCRYAPPKGGGRDLAFIVFHPTSNFHGHYLVEPLSRLGAGVLALNTRYVGNDSMLIMERAIQDVGAGMRFLREQGYKRIIMIGNSGGGSLAAFYQEQATRVTVTSTPDGRPFDMASDPLHPADALALVAAHPGRASQLLAKIDPSVLDESDAPAIDASLDMFDPRHGPAYSPEFVARFRAAQARRLDRITDWVVQRLQDLDRTRHADVADDAFVIRRTQADPRNMDLLLDANDRKQGSLGGDARNYNEAANGLARFCTLRSFLSQWSVRHTRAEGPRCLAATNVPVLLLNYTADQTVFPSHVAAWQAAAAGRCTTHDIKGAPHYLIGMPEVTDRVAGLLMAFGD